MAATVEAAALLGEAGIPLVTAVADAGGKETAAEAWECTQCSSVATVMACFCSSTAATREPAPRVRFATVRARSTAEFTRSMLGRRSTEEGVAATLSAN